VPSKRLGKVIVPIGATAGLRIGADARGASACVETALDGAPRSFALIGAMGAECAPVAGVSFKALWSSADP
jgi:hypothetical protein